MTPNLRYPEWEFKPRKLNKEEINSPYTVVHEFFDYANLPQVRELLWQWLEATITGNFNKRWNTRNRNDLLYFYQQIEKMIEAMHLLHITEQNKKQRGNKSKK